MEVKAWVEKVIIPTYKVGEPEKNPMFLEKRVYQGSSGVVYPHPVIEKIADEKTDREYTAVYLENDYLKIMILPEIGGRIQRAYDKIRQRDFVYYNQVIKPALVGLAGPWISGGIEFNWPQHHRPSTFCPVDYSIESNGDGSKTVWVNETEIMFRTNGKAGFTLYPGKAFMEIKGKVFNRTPFPQTFLWWANPAVKVNDYYQSVFPPDVYAVYDHGKRDVSDFPIATGTYYKMDYAPGTDISRYNTIPVPTSYMAVRSKYDFMGCYEHDSGGGMLHIADHHFSPGKKQWTWGNGDFGYAWDRNLTDEDGPYIELMTGVFTDNQPDFSWLQPNEEKTFEQYFMPYAKIGLVKNATKEAMLNIEFGVNEIQIKVYATAVYPDSIVTLLKNNEPVKTYITNLSPETILEETFISGGSIIEVEWKIMVADNTGKELVAYQPEAPIKKDIPSAAAAMPVPVDVKEVEDLFLNGLHLEQYRHATFNAMDYYEEGLRRSPGDFRCNNAAGLFLLRRGQFKQAEVYFRKAIETITKRNPNPYDGEAYYNLGWSLKLQGQLTEAYESFYKATWNDTWQHSGFLSLARTAAAGQNWALALSFINKSLNRNFSSTTARHLKSILLRKMGMVEEALSFSAASLETDIFNYGCLFEQHFVYSKVQDEKAGTVLLQMQGLMRNELNNYLELALDYAQAGLYEDAISLLVLVDANKPGVTPMLYYYLGWLSLEAGDNEKAADYYTIAANAQPDHCFPNKIEEVLILQAAIEFNKTDSLAYYLLGNLWYDKRQYKEAIECWENSLKAKDNFATVYRNLSLAYYNKLGEKHKAISYMEKAFSLDTKDSRILMELDQLYKITGRSFAERLNLLESNAALVKERDDLCLEQITLYNNLRKFEQAKQLLERRKFHPWEGGEGKVVAQYLTCHVELAKKAILENRFEDALRLLIALDKYPENLGEGKLYGTQENDIHYLLGCVYDGLQQPGQAIEKFELATRGISEPAQAIFYNDPQPDKIVYQALAWRKLGENNKAETIFKQFIQFGEAHMNDVISLDYFAVSLPDMLVYDIDLGQLNKIHCKYLVGLGYLGLNDEEKAIPILQEVLQTDINHQGAANHLKMLSFFKQPTASNSVRL